MDASREGLLQPSLDVEARPVAAPYSVQATFFTGFFGGPFAAIALLAVNSLRLRRQGRDWPVLGVCLLGAIFVGWVLHGPSPAFTFIRDWLSSVLGPSSVRYAYRLVALLIVGVGYLMHRREQRNAEIFGLTRPNGWVAGLLCIAGGLALLGILMVAMGASR